MSTSGPDDSPPQTPDELGGLDPKDLFNAGLETMPPVTLPPQSADPDATIPVAGPRPSQPSAPQVELPLPEELTQLLPSDAYQVESFLGQGGMGAVYKGTQVRLKRPVAIKIMRRDLGKDYDFEARFEREAQAMAKLNHPNIVSVIDFGEAGPNYLYIVMELIDGADMMDVIRTGRMTQEMALTLLPQICDALQFAHDHGIVHRDIKPSNIMLTRDGRIKMADFGLAKRYDVESSFRTQTGTGMGTPDYAAPEQFDPNAPIDHRADIYALGVMIYQMITGQLPRGVWKPPSQRAEVAPQWDDIVSRAMQSDPSDRYQQASEVKTDVSSIPLAESRRSRQTAEVAAPTAPQPRALASTPTKSRIPLIFGLIVGAVVIAIGAFFVLKKPAQSGPLTPVSGTSNTKAPAAPPQVVTSAKPAAAVSTSPSLPVSKSSTQFPPGQWVKRFTKPEDLPANLRKPDSGVKFEDGWLRFVGKSSNSIGVAPELQKNYAIRCRFKRDTVTGHSPGLVVRHGMDDGGQDSYYGFDLSPKKELLIKRKQSGPQGDSFPHSFIGKATEAELAQSEEVIEFGAVGDHLVARLGRSFVKLVSDPHLHQGTGSITRGGASAIRDIEVINLDGLPEAEALRLLGVDEQGNDLRGKTGAAATSATPTPVWRDALAEAPLKKVIATANHTDKGYLLPPGNHWEFPAQPVRAGAIRVLAATEAGSPNHLSLNFGLPGTRDHYQVFFRRKLNECGLSYLKEGLPERRLALKKGVTPADGEPHELLLARIADQFYFLLNGEVILQAAEPDPTARYLTLNCFGDTHARVQKVEYLNLDGVSETEALRLLGVDEQRNDLRGK